MNLKNKLLMGGRVVQKWWFGVILRPNLCENGRRGRLNAHSLSFIRNTYKEQFSWLVKSFEKIRNRLVIFLKIKEQRSYNISEKHGFPSKNCSL